ncbi:hypothetical protein Tco_0511880 [Tanacetum coccineum]
MAIAKDEPDVGKTDARSDHWGKFDEKADDGFFLGYSLVARVFKREMASTSVRTNPSLMINSWYHEKPLNQFTRNDDSIPYVPAFDPLSTNNITIPDLITTKPEVISSSPDLPVTDDLPFSS